VNDIDDVLLQARHALSGARMETPVEAILAKGRSRRQRRRLVQLSAAGAAASGCLALALGVAAVAGSGSPALAPGTIRTAAFTLAKNADGTTTLALNDGQMFDAAALQKALARDGIPALVQTGVYCTSTAAPPISGVLSTRLRDGSRAAAPGHRSPAPPVWVTVINPAAMPAGTELSFTYDHNHNLFGSLIYTDAHTCTSR
jgi:hypothetical protein